VSAYESDGESAGKSDGGGLGLRHYLEVVRRRKWIVILTTALAIGAAVAVSVTQKKMYEATTKVVVGQGNSLFPTTVANAVQPYTATMADLVESNLVAERVISNLGLHTTPEKFLERMSVSINPQTAVMQIAVKNHDKALAVRITRQVGTVFHNLVRERFGKTPAAPTTPGTAPQQPLTATIFDPAHAEPQPVSPKPVRNTVIAGVLGFALGLVAAFLREHFDRRLRTREAVERAFGVPVIGQIPTIPNAKTASAYTATGEVSEAFRALRANLEYLAVRRPLRTLLVTSAAPPQGKTTVTANLAVTHARSGDSTMAIEADLRRPRLNELLGRSDGGGLSSVIVGVINPDDAALDLPLPEGAEGVEPGRLSFVPSGPLPPNPTELLSSDQMTRLLDRFSSLYDHVVIDSPPLLLVADALELARVVDGVIVVARRNEATSDEAREVRDLIERLGINLVGVVFTDVAAPAGYGYESYARKGRGRSGAEVEWQPVEVDRT
jgi:succinoglycan biosynthesis transport protein ExoP